MLIKKIWITALICTVLLSFAGCDFYAMYLNSRNQANDSSVAQEESLEESSPSSLPEQDNNSSSVSIPSSDQEGTPSEGSIGDYYIKIGSAKKEKDYSGKDVLIVTYTWTNNSDEEQMFSSAFNITAYQNGIECDSFVLVDEIDSKKSITNIKPGVSYEVQDAYALNGNDDVVIEVKEWFSFDDEVKVTKTFSLE